VLLIEQLPLAAAVEAVGGAKGISVPDVLEPFQISLPMYIGATTPSASSEVPHWHPDQAEAYVVLAGEAEMISKHRWIDEGWVRVVARPGDVLVVRPEACHWFRWQSAAGLALVFKAPQRAGVGRFPAGKVVCASCPHYERGCVGPRGFVPRV
jgi:mannose-6-phosphate isomerase-like protein (cupin superfamily)